MSRACARARACVHVHRDVHVPAARLECRRERAQRGGVVEAEAVGVAAEDLIAAAWLHLGADVHVCVCMCA